MFTYQEIKEVHFEITSKCQAKCPMCPRRIQGGPLNPFIEINEVGFDDFKQWFPIDFLNNLNRFFMCGNLGDPILAKDTLEIFQYLRENNPNINLSMHTNGSARSEEWWIQVARAGVETTFGIDGLSDTHSLYRIDTDWNKIIKNAKAFINAGGSAIWTMLVFEHNEHQIDQCKNLSKDLGFIDFKVKHTSRFKLESLAVIDDLGYPLYYINPTQKSRENSLKVLENLNETVSVSCKAKQQNQIYVSADGGVSPCCWLDLKWTTPSNENRIDYIEKIGQFPNLNKLSMKEIFDRGFFNEIENTWECSPLKECSKQCGKHDKLGVQFDVF